LKNRYFDEYLNLGHYDDSSDEEDIFLDSDLETLKRNSQNKYSQGSELQNAFILELEGRRVLYHNKIRRKYLNLKHQLFGNQVISFIFIYIQILFIYLYIFTYFIYKVR
jgi:hypothetical protein